MRARRLGHGYGTRKAEGWSAGLRQWPPFHYRMVERRIRDLWRVFREP